MAENCLVLLKEDVPVDPRKYGALAAFLLGIPRIEARMAVRKGRGILLENLPQEAALKIVEELGTDGIAARAVSRDALPPLPAPRKATQLLRRDETLAADVAEETLHLPWEALLVVSCGVVALPGYKDLFSHIAFDMIPTLRELGAGEKDIVLENLVLKFSTPPPPDEKEKPPKPASIFEQVEEEYASRLKVYADLVTADLGTWLRAPLGEMSYAHEAGGVRFGGSWGFRLLLRELAERRRDALTGMTLKLLGAAAIKEVVFPQVEEFNRYTAWAAIRGYAWPDADSSSPSPGPPGPSTDGGSSNASSGPGPTSTSS